MAKKKILVIDDEVAITKLLKLVLERSGKYDVQCENEGTQAVSVIKAFGPDLILLDVNLPDISGGEIAGALRDKPAFSHIPIIFLTGMISAEEAQAGQTIGGRAAVSKPIDMARLVDCIEKYLPT